ncbi:MAG TPA: GntR family transcriptional regulator [Firmicutes bacterium]|nr:GntR family transcriptional regulator [Bacillota bacterium]
MKRRLLLTSLRERLYETLKEDILLNKYEPGEELQIDKLAQEFGVSTTPIREALVRLEGDGLVVSIPNRGVQVAPISLDDVRNLYEVRRLLEPYVAKIAARYCEEGEVEALYEKLVHLIEGPTDLAAYINADLELHELMSQHLRNTLLKDILNQVDQHSIRVRYLAESSAGGLRPEVVELVTREHLKILDAIRKRNEEKAAAATLQHLTNAEARTLKSLKEVLTI